MSAVIKNINFTQYRHYRFIKNITITPYARYSSNEPLECCSVNFTLKQTKFYIVSHLLDDGESSTPPPGLVIGAHHEYPKMSPSVRFEPLSTCSWGNLRFSLKFCLGLDDKEEEEVLDEIYKHIITNDGYNQGLLTMHLFVTINESIAVHLGAKLPSIAALDVTETRHIWEKLCSISAVDDTEMRQRAKVDEVVVQGGGGGEENCCVCFEELANEEQLVGLSCKHVFHEGCIVEWLGNSLSCPLCRFRLHAVLS